MEFKKEVLRLVDIYEDLEKYDVDLSQAALPSLDFKKSRHNLYIQSLEQTVKRLRSLVETIRPNEDDFDTLKQIKGIVSKLDTKDKDQLKLLTFQLRDLSNMIRVEEEKVEVPSSIPSDIYEEVKADLNEISICMTAGCYRSAVILCGRIIEVLLHRKYYEATENDLLEKSPGIGLGNVIAKMKEKGIEFDPGITQQIHLINQVRVFSVHKKQQPFNPSREQAEAMVLYTRDIMQKLFA